MMRYVSLLGNLLASLVVGLTFIYVAATGLGPIPPLGPVLNPGTGVWTAAADAQRPQNGETLHLAGLNTTVKATFERNGTTHIAAQTNHDMFFALGYLHARDRLLQMDLLRRQGEGLLSQVVGPDALSSDQFELQLGLLRTARQEWSALKPGSASYNAILAYTQGVNTRIQEDEAQHNLPLLFKMLGYSPTLWTPVDSFVVQGDLVQTLDFTDVPLDNTLLAHYLGAAHQAAWFPTLPPDAQHPYDPGPYRKGPSVPFSTTAQAGLNGATVDVVASLERRLAALPIGEIHYGANSNNWAVDGTKTASGKPLMAGDPHLHQTLPAVWYQVQASSPGYNFGGVSVPGTPVILIGRNQHISWSLTNVQNQATFFYAEKTDATHHPHQYYWNGVWRTMTHVPYDIPIKGGQTYHVDVYLTVHGPIISDSRAANKTVAVDWIGAVASPDLDVMRTIMQAPDFKTFRNALRAWHAPSQNFVYTDDKGAIGMVSAGYYPILKGGDPSFLLAGTGGTDIVGTIPFDAVPQVYDPPSHIVWSANQRPVGPSYPYAIGTTANFFDNGYRANRIYEVLSQGKKLTATDMEKLQNDTHDYLAGLITPKLLAALKGVKLTAREQAARALLVGWNGNMDVNSAAATIWWGFWSSYIHDTFQPWWTRAKVPTTMFPSLAVAVGQPSLDEDLETWTLSDPRNAAFTVPGSKSRTANDVMVQAFGDAVAAWTKTLGSNPRTWTWGRWHKRQFDSLVSIPTLQYGPRAGNGDAWTVDAADGGQITTSGPSWRFVMDWGSGRAVGVYPGGQSENPLSPWYENQIATWWNGQYYPMLDDATARAQGGAATWTLTP